MIFRIFLVTAILYLSPESNASSTPGVCTSQACLHAASRIYRYINPQVNPCDNFFKFACGTFIKDAHGDRDLSFFRQLYKQFERERVELYSEDIQEDDNKLVKIAKRLYRGCLNEPQIEEDAVETLKNVFKQVGGWPVLEESEWNESNFDWLNATYKLRDFGYFGIFIDLVTSYVAEEHRYRLELLSGDVSNEELEVMTKMAMKFDFKNKENVMKDLEGAYRLSNSISQIWNNKAFDTQVMTLKKLKENLPSIDWIQFINHIAAPVVQVTEKDEVSIRIHYLQPLLELIAKTPKRDLANFMMWKVVKNVLPYFKDGTVNSVGRYKCQNRAECCAEMMEMKFYPSPMEVIYNRRYLSAEKKKKIEEMAASMKAIAIEKIEGADWLSDSQKKQMVHKLQNLRIQIGLPGYLDDTIFNYSDVDMVDVKNGTFFDLLARAERNSKASKYLLVKNSEGGLYNLYYLFARRFGYISAENLIYIPAYKTTEMVYDKNAPEYMNYGIMGMIIGNYVDTLLCFSCNGDYSKKSADLISTKRKCVKDTWHELDDWDTKYVLATNVVQQITYEAYQKWVKANGEEQKLHSVEYTPNQLFWISLATRLCRPVGLDNYWALENKKDAAVTSAYEVNNLISWLNKFIDDFKCPKGSKMNPKQKCNLF